MFEIVNLRYKFNDITVYDFENYLGSGSKNNNIASWAIPIKLLSCYDEDDLFIDRYTSIMNKLYNSSINNAEYIGSYCLFLMQYTILFAEYSWEDIDSTINDMLLNEKYFPYKTYDLRTTQLPECIERIGDYSQKSEKVSNLYKIMIEKHILKKYHYFSFETGYF